MKRDDRTWLAFAAVFATPLLALGAILLRQWRAGRREGVAR